jgi:hypothetical protein
MGHRVQATPPTVVGYLAQAWTRQEYRVMGSRGRAIKRKKAVRRGQTTFFENGR